MCLMPDTGRALFISFCVMFFGGRHAASAKTCDELQCLNSNPCQSLVSRDNTTHAQCVCSGKWAGPRCELQLHLTLTPNSLTSSKAALKIDLMTSLYHDVTAEGEGFSWVSSEDSQELGIEYTFVYWRRNDTVVPQSERDTKAFSPVVDARVLNSPLNSPGDLSCVLLHKRKSRQFNLDGLSPRTRYTVCVENGFVDSCVLSTFADSLASIPYSDVPPDILASSQDSLPSNCVTVSTPGSSNPADVVVPSFIVASISVSILIVVFVIFVVCLVRRRSDVVGLLVCCRQSRCCCDGLELYSCRGDLNDREFLSDIENPSPQLNRAGAAFLVDENQRRKNRRGKRTVSRFQYSKEKLNSSECHQEVKLHFLESDQEIKLGSSQCDQEILEFKENDLEKLDSSQCHVLPGTQQRRSQKKMLESSDRDIHPRIKHQPIHSPPSSPEGLESRETSPFNPYSHPPSPEDLEAIRETCPLSSVFLLSSPEDLEGRETSPFNAYSLPPSPEDLEAIRETCPLSSGLLLSPPEHLEGRETSLFNSYSLPPSPEDLEAIRETCPLSSGLLLSSPEDLDGRDISPFNSYSLPPSPEDVEAFGEVLPLKPDSLEPHNEPVRGRHSAEPEAAVAFPSTNRRGRLKLPWPRFKSRKRRGYVTYRHSGAKDKQTRLDTVLESHSDDDVTADVGLMT